MRSFCTVISTEWFQKVSVLPSWKCTGNSWGGGGGSLKVKLLEEKYEAKLEFLGGDGMQNITLQCSALHCIALQCNLPWGRRYGYFLELPSHVSFVCLGMM